jgi:predicted  nucleic acid-binding Zn-ribbon protein
VADAPWRCSQCGTVNEPVANACRTCGRWPSLFELEGSTIETDVRPAREEEDPFAAQTVEVEQLEPEVFEVEPDIRETPEPSLPPEFEAEDEDVEAPKPIWQRLASLIVPIGIVLYIIISALADR